MCIRDSINNKLIFEELNFKIWPTTDLSKLNFSLFARTADIKDGEIDLSFNGKIELNSLNGQPISVEVPSGSTTNIVSEQISVSNLPNEELIAVVMGGGARRINAEFNFLNDNQF